MAGLKPLEISSPRKITGAPHIKLRIEIKLVESKISGRKSDNDNNLIFRFLTMMARSGGNKNTVEHQICFPCICFWCPTWPLWFLTASSLTGIIRALRFIFPISCPDLGIRYFFQKALVSKNEQGWLTHCYRAGR